MKKSKLNIGHVPSGGLQAKKVQADQPKKERRLIDRLTMTMLMSRKVV